MTTITVNQIMTHVRDYGERESVEHDLEVLLEFLKHKQPTMYSMVAESFFDVVEAVDPFIETDLTWESLKEGDEVLLTKCYVNKKKTPIRMVVMHVEEEIVALRECDRWVAVPWMGRDVFETRIITHWTKKDNHE